MHLNEGNGSDKNQINMFRLFLFLIIFRLVLQSENDVLSKSKLGEKYKTLMLEEGIVRSEDEFLRSRFFKSVSYYKSKKRYQKN